MADRIEISPPAERDLDRFVEYLQEHASDSVALRFLDRAHGTFAKLASSPFLGGRRESDSADLSEVRVWPIKSFPRHLVLYEPITDGIRVIRVLHASQGTDLMHREDTP